MANDILRDNLTVQNVSVIHQGHGNGVPRVYILAIKNVKRKVINIYDITENRRNIVDLKAGDIKPEDLSIGGQGNLD